MLNTDKINGGYDVRVDYNPWSSSGSEPEPGNVAVRFDCESLRRIIGN
jgi:hypothetical protein